MDDPPSLTQKWALTSESFNRLLSWLHPDRDQAGLKYEEIRSMLIRRFVQLSCRDPEDLANETIDRVARKLPEVIDKYKGDPEPYFFSVAYYVFMEYLRRPIMQSLAKLDRREPVAPNSEELAEKELLDSCLRDCLDQMNQRDRETILTYYRGDRQVKIKARKALAESLGIDLRALRLRTQRIRASLKKCILDCMERKVMERQFLS